MKSRKTNLFLLAPCLVAVSMIFGPPSGLAQDGTFCATLKSVPERVVNHGGIDCECGENSSIDWEQVSISVQNAQVGPVGVSGKISVGGAGGNSGSGGNGGGQEGDSKCWALTIVTPAHREAVIPGPLLVKEVGKLKQRVIVRECDKSDCDTFLFFFTTGEATCRVVSCDDIQTDLPIYQIVGMCKDPSDGNGNGAGPGTPPPSGGKGPKTGGGAKGPTTGGGSNGPTTPGGEG